MEAEGSARNQVQNRNALLLPIIGVVLGLFLGVAAGTWHQEKKIENQIMTDALARLALLEQIPAYISVQDDEAVIGIVDAVAHMEIAYLINDSYKVDNAVEFQRRNRKVLVNFGDSYCISETRR